MSIVHYNRLNRNRAEGITLQSSVNGTFWTSQSSDNPPVFGAVSGLLPVEAISCAGCEAIRSSNGCLGTFKTA